MGKRRDRYQEERSLEDQIDMVYEMGDLIAEAEMERERTDSGYIWFGDGGE